MVKRMVAYPILVFIVLYLAFPYYALYSLRVSLNNGDREKVDRGVDFESLKTSLKDQLNVYLAKFLNEKKIDSSFFPEKSAMAMMKTKTDGLFDDYLTPDGLIYLITRGEVSGALMLEDQDFISSRNDFLDFEDLNFAFFSNPTTFKVMYNHVRLKFKLQDWWWKLSDIVLPLPVQKDPAITPQQKKEVKSDPQVEETKDY